MTTLQKAISILIGSFMLIEGLNKFRESYITLFQEQIMLSGLSFLTLSKLAGELGEITAGITLLTLLFFWKKIPVVLADRAFYIANLLIFSIMSVTVSVHLHAAVPSEILPFSYKPPVLTVITMFLAVLNIYLHRVNRFHQRLNGYSL